MTSPCTHVAGECGSTCASCGVLLNCQLPSESFCSEMCQRKWVQRFNGDVPDLERPSLGW